MPLGFCHISPLLRCLHWLPVKARIEFKIPLITFKAIHGLAPKYLCGLLTFKSSLYNLRFSDSILLSMPAVRSKTLGDTAFIVAAPRLWSSLPKEFRAITNVNCLACVAGAKRGGGGGREKGKREGRVSSPSPQSPSPFSLPPYPLPPTPFDACYAG